MVDKFTPPVPEDSLRFIRNKEIRPSFSYKDVWQSEHHTSFTVAKSAGFDVLADIKSALQDAIEKGQTLRTFQKNLKPTLVKKGWWGEKEVVDPVSGETKVAQLGSPRRLETIYRANVRSARAAGQYDRAQRTKRTRPYFLYKLGPSESHRDEHAAWAAKPLVAHVDDPIWDRLYPPNGWGCKCWLLQVSESRLRDMGIEPPDGPVPTPPEEDHANDRTGEETRIIKGVDPAWNGNPGKTRRENITQALTGKMKELPLTAVQTTIKDLGDIGYISEFVAMAKDPVGVFAIPVTPVSDELAKLVNVKNTFATMSERTAAKQAVRRQSNMLAREHDFLPYVGDPQIVIRDNPERLNEFITITRLRGRLYHTAYRIDGDELRISSFRRTDLKEVRRKMKKGLVLKGDLEGL